jgi:toluene monooxygenase electron transfer component
MAPRIPMKITVHGKSSEFAFDCAEHESILYGGLRQGVGLPFECATGTCGTCRARVVAGDIHVTWKEAPGGARLKPEKGDILMCQTRARSDCVLRVPAADTIAESSRPAFRRGVIHGIRRLTKDVAHFDLQLSAPMSFEPGQFVVLEAARVSGGRAYSMVNFAADCERLGLVIKRKPGGRFGDWLFDELQGEASVAVFGPLGRAVFRPEEGRNIVCIAGGSGIAGMMAILDCAVQADHFRSHTGAVYFGVRTLLDGFYLEQLSRYVTASHGNLEIVIALSDEAAPAAVHPEFPQLKLASGMVHEVAGREMAGRDRNVLAYIAGPPIMVESTIRSLVVGGLAIKDIRYDKFS